MSIVRKRLTIKLNFKIIKPQTLLFILSDPLKFLLVKTLEDIEILEEYSKEYANIFPSKLAGKSRPGVSVFAKIHEQILNNRKFLKELFNTGEVKKIEFLYLFNEILTKYLNSKSNEIRTNSQFLEMISEIFEDLSKVAVSVVTEKYSSSIDEIYVVRKGRDSNG